MRQPLTFAYRNLLFGRDQGEAWALYRLEMRSYDGLTTSEKRELLFELASFAHSVEADFQVLRVSRTWSLDDYVRAAQMTLDGRSGHPGMWGEHLRSHQQILAGRNLSEPEVYLAVRLNASASRPERRAGVARLLDEALFNARRGLGLSDPRGLTERALDALLDAESKCLARSSDYIDCRRAQTQELQWLIGRAFCRGVFEPLLDERFLPQALVFSDERDEIRYRPLECDLLRLMDRPINIAARSLRIESEAGDSHQAVLVLGALPDTVAFPGRQAELLFSPLESLGFPVDASFSARFVPNPRALALARRKLIDADNTYEEESAGDHGPSTQGADRPSAARELEDYLAGEGRPPLLRAAISLAVGAPTAEELEDRVEAVRREYAPVQLHRPLGEQLRLFVSHLPAQPSGVPDYDDYLLVEQFGATVPIATRTVGSEVGPLIGRTLSAQGRPVVFDLTEASRTSRPPSILCAGTLGSGKTMLLQLLLYQAFLQGSRIVDIDPKGDHALHELPGVSEHTEVIELSADEAFRGMLDPIRIAPPGTTEDLTTSFLVDVLPDPVPAAWRTEIRRAVRATVAADRATSSAVIQELMRGNAEAREAGAALAVHASTGLARLGFGRHGQQPPDAGGRQVTSLRIRKLARPLPGTPKSELSEDERIGQAVLRLVAAYAMHLMGSDRTRHKVLGFDEAWFLLADSVGRRLIEHLNRWARSEFATPILVTHLLADAEEVDNLIGARFVFGMEAESEAAGALALLRLDSDDERLRQQVMQFRRGRCFMRDYRGRVAPVQIEPGEQLLAALDTTPRAPGSAQQVAGIQ